MFRLKLGLLSIIFACLAVALTGCGGGAGSNQRTSPGQINHVVIIFQENRTPDNLFHDTVLMSRGADIATQGQTSTGQTVTLTPVPLVTSYDLGHGHLAFLKACDYNPSTNACAMDGADLDSCGPGDCPTYPEYQYVQQSDVQPYFTMAETYAFGDRMFQTNQGDSFPAHQYILAGTSRVCTPQAECPSGITTSVTISDNPANNERPDGTYWAGCLAPPGSTINAIDLSQPFPQSGFGITQLCLEHPTLTDLLNNAGLSWKYYAALPGDIWTAPNAIQHMCVPSPAYPSETSQCTGSDWMNHVVIEGSGAQIVTDIGNQQLSAVTWVIPDGANSDHADGNTGGGPSWVASIVNAIGESPYWADTAIIVTWDDWGGWYDHVGPTILNSYEYGLRVPLIVISTYAKPQYVSHQPNDFGSILRFIEETFSLQDVDYANPDVPYADSYALGDLSDFFNFSQPQPFTYIQSPLQADHFLNDKSPPTPPDTD
jgi:phospholipase C